MIPNLLGIICKTKNWYILIIVLLKLYDNIQDIICRNLLGLIC